MTPKFEAGIRVKFTDAVVASCPVYEGREYTVRALAHEDWGIGKNNEWYGLYLIEGENGVESLAYESALVAVGI